jgi:hypothetical protein
MAFTGQSGLSLPVQLKNTVLVQLILRHDYKDNHDVAKTY